VPSSKSEPTKNPDTTDWGREVELAVSGDRRAYARLIRLITGHLAHWRAYDFQSDWDDIVQEVILSVVQAHAAGKLDPPGAVKAYARQATRFKFIDRIRAHTRAAPGVDLETAEQRANVSWPPAAPIGDRAHELRMSLEAALLTLPERERAAVVEVHVNGKTYEEAAADTGIPLGSLKRALRTGLSALRERLAGDFEP
jgi:RNA polymerase sigma-70 factor (ECF subfamily)